MENPNPVLYKVDKAVQHYEYDPSLPLTSEHIFNWIKNINDPEHPMSLEELGVVQKEHIEVSQEDEAVKVRFTPTIPHCSMATLIGLCIKIRLQRELPSSYWIAVSIREGSHVSEEAINKQLGDKERVSAALENPNLLNVIQLCLDGPPQPGIIHAAQAN